MLLIAACAPVQVPVIVTRTPPAELVRLCPREPILPEQFADEAERFSWALNAINTGRVCRAAHDKLSQWEKEPPK
jgi:hypothetical protein